MKGREEKKFSKESLWFTLKDLRFGCVTFFFLSPKELLLSRCLSLGLASNVGKATSEQRQHLQRSGWLFIVDEKGEYFQVWVVDL